jgi:hypothetical protein
VKNLKFKTLSARKFLLFITIYLVISLAAFLLPGGGYSALFFLFGVGLFYFLIWILLALMCIKSQRVRYLPLLIYLILPVQVVAVLFNIPDSGYYGITCDTKNVVQYFFDRSRCQGLWMSYETYIPILSLYLFLVFIFVFNVLWLRFASSESTH